MSATASVFEDSVAYSVTVILAERFEVNPQDPRIPLRPAESTPTGSRSVYQRSLIHV